MRIYFNGKNITKNAKYILADVVLGAALIWQVNTLADNVKTNKPQEIKSNTNISIIKEDNNNDNINDFYSKENKVLPKETIEEKTRRKMFYAYTIRKGDSLDELANAFSCSKEEIMELNGLTDELIHPKQVINIPYYERVNTHAKIGIDVSAWNDTIDWEVTKNYVDYAIIRLCNFESKKDNGQPIIDKKFIENISECNRLGIPVGIYAYTNAFTQNEARDEALFVLDQIKNFKIEYPIYFDIESKEHQQAMLEDLPSIVKVVESFCHTIEDNGYYVGIYAGDYDMQLLTKYSKYLNQFDKWVARYEDNPKAFIETMQEKNIKYNGQYNMQQAGSVGIVPGINTDVDVNFAYIDFQNVIRNAGLNNLNNKTK